VARLNPGASSAYDIPEVILNANRYGWLPQDRRHQLKIQGSYRFDFGMVLGAHFIYKYQTYYQTPDYLSDVTSGNLRRDLNWGKTSGRQGSRNARLGVKWTF